MPRLVLPAVVYGAILAVSSVPGDGLDGLGLPAAFDVVGHTIEYAALGASLRWALDGLRWPVGATVVVGALLGAADELYQSTVPGRSPTVADVAVDVVAVAAAALLVGRLLLRRRGGRVRGRDG